MIADFVSVFFAVLLAELAKMLIDRYIKGNINNRLDVIDKHLLAIMKKEGEK